MIIYLDIIFFENYIMNFLILLSMKIALKNKKKISRLLLASAIGAFFYVMEFIALWINYVQLLVACVVLIIAFGYSNIKALIKNIAMFYFISLLFGGVSFWIMNLLNMCNYGIYNGIIIGRFNVFLVIISGLIGLFLVVSFLNKKMRHVINSVVIILNGKRVLVNVLLDTGNLLREPYCNRPVLIVEKNAFSEVLDEDILLNFHDIIIGKLQIPKGMFFIPYKSLGINCGYLVGVKPDCIILKDTGQRCEDVVIGICEDIICENGKYSGIIGLDIFNGGMCYEYC